MRQIAIINESRAVSAADAMLMARACNVQLRDHVAKSWGRLRWSVRYRSAKAEIGIDEYPIVIADEAKPGSGLKGTDLLGVHEEDADGRAFGTVFAGRVLDDGGTLMRGPDSVSATLSHEVLETFINPDLNLWAEDAAGLLWRCEICDPVEAFAYTISLSGRRVAVSDFVYPSWFDSENPQGTRFSFRENVRHAFEVGPGGSAIVYEGGHEEDVRFGRSAIKNGWRQKRKDGVRALRDGPRPHSAS